MSKYRSVNKEEQSYSDAANYPKGGTLQYAIQTIFKDERNQTILSKQVTVTIPATQ